MSGGAARVVGVGFLFLFAFLAGLWLSQTGKPYSGIVLAIHKLIALAAMAIIGIALYQANQAGMLSGGELAAGVVSGLLFLGTIITGGLLSIERPMPGAVLTMHQLTPFLTVFSSAATLYLLLGRE